MRKRSERCGPRETAPAWIPGLALLLALAGPLACGADTADAHGEAAALPNARLPHTPSARTQSVLDERVQKLSRTLNLDAAQQSQLREVLAMQREQMTRVWSDSSVPSAYRISATRAIGNQTAERIRALLTEEQRAQFSQPSQRPREAAPGTRSVEDWMNAAGAGHP
jgi:hypothetical protein